MKKLLLIILALSMCISMCACSEEIAPSKDDSAPIVSNVEDNVVSNGEDNEIESSLVESSMNDVSESEESELEEIKPEPCKHDYQITAYTKPTCTENGSQTYKCVKCSDTYSENVPAAGHDWENATCTSPKTCKICQETSGSANGHDWKSATCKAPKTCKDCGETSGSIGEHAFDGSTCTICGQTNYSSDAEIAQALKKIERYVKYIEINKDLIANEYDLYCLSGDLQYFNDAHEHTLEINEYLKKVIEIFEDINSNHYFIKSIPSDCQECILSMPTVPSNTSSTSIKSYMRKCSSFAEKADRVFVFYEKLCETFGA